MKDHPLYSNTAMIAVYFVHCILTRFFIHLQRSLVTCSTLLSGESVSLGLLSLEDSSTTPIIGQRYIVCCAACCSVSSSVVDFSGYNSRSICKMMCKLTLLVLSLVLGLCCITNGESGGVVICCTHTCKAL